MHAVYGYDVAADLRPGTRYDEVVRALGGAGELVTSPGRARARAAARLRLRRSVPGQRDHRRRGRVPAHHDRRVAPLSRGSFQPGCRGADAGGELALPRGRRGGTRRVASAGEQQGALRPGIGAALPVGQPLADQRACQICPPGADRRLEQASVRRVALRVAPAELVHPGADRHQFGRARGRTVPVPKCSRLRQTGRPTIDVIAQPVPSGLIAATTRSSAVDDVAGRGRSSPAPTNAMIACMSLNG